MNNGNKVKGKFKRVQPVMVRNSGIDSMTWVQHTWRNRLHSIILLAVMAGFLSLLGWLLWGPDGIIMLLMLGVIGSLFNPSISPWLVMRLYGASLVRPQQAPVLWNILAQLSERAGLSNQPDLYYVPSRMLNAFAVGSRDQSAIAITDGLLRQLELRELAGVLAHEVSHIRSNDLWIMGFADMLSRTTSILSLIGQFLFLVNLPLLLITGTTINWFAILLLILAPVISALAQTALSRTREYDADLNAVQLTGDPDGLASGLIKIERAQGGWLERVFMPGRRIPEPSLLRTHPDTEDRVSRLMELKPQIARSGYSLLPYNYGIDTDAIFGRPVARIPRWHISGLWH